MNFNKPRIAIYYYVLDKTGRRNDGPPIFINYNLRKILDGNIKMEDSTGNVVHLWPSNRPEDYGKFDLHVWVDFGEDALAVPLDWYPPSPNCYWVSDAHINEAAYKYRMETAKKFDHVFVAQKEFIEKFVADWTKDKLKELNIDVPHKQIVELANEILRVREISSENIRKILPLLSSGIHASVEKISSSNENSAVENELSFLYSCLFEAGYSKEVALQEVRKCFISGTSSKLQETSSSDLALSSLSLETSPTLNLPKIHYLPHAFEPDVYRPYDIINRWDWCFIGHPNSPHRIDLLDRLCKEFPNWYVGWRNAAAPGYNALDDVAYKLSQSKVGVNYSVNKDLNMRVFETLGTKTCLLTDDIPDIKELFEDMNHLVLFKSEEEAVEKMKLLLADENTRLTIAENGYQEVLKKHTYRHRAEEILKTCLNYVPKGELVC